MNPTSQPKARFHARLDERDFLGLTVWPGKTDPAAEVIVVQIRRREGDDWKVSCLHVAGWNILETS